MLENVFSILKLDESDERGREKNCCEQRQIDPDHKVVVQLRMNDWQEEDVAEAQAGREE